MKIPIVIIWLATALGVAAAPLAILVTHSRQPASFSDWQFESDVKERGKSCVTVAVSAWREAAAYRPSL